MSVKIKQRSVTEYIDINREPSLGARFILVDGETFRIHPLENGKTKHRFNYNECAYLDIVDVPDLIDALQKAYDDATSIR